VVIYTDAEKTEMAASFLSGHRRAKNLVGKQLLIEFDWLERSIEALSRFTQQAANALSFANEPWPKIPPTPNQRPRKRRSDGDHDGDRLAGAGDLPSTNS